VTLESVSLARSQILPSRRKISGVNSTRPAGSRRSRGTSPLLLFFVLLAVAWLTSPAEGSLPRTGFQDANPAALAGAEVVDGGQRLAGIETPFSLITVEELQEALARNPAPEAGGLNLVESSLLEPPELTSRACAARFSLHMEAVDFGLNPQRGPPFEIPDLHQGEFVADPRTRIGGFGLELEDLIKGECPLSPGSRRGYGVDRWGIAEEERPDPWGLFMGGVVIDAIKFCLSNPSFCAGVGAGIREHAEAIATAPARIWENEGREAAAKSQAYARGGLEERSRVAAEINKGHTQAMEEMVPGVGSGRRLGELWEECGHSGLSYECGRMSVPAAAAVSADAAVVSAVAGKATQMSRAAKVGGTGESVSVPAAGSQGAGQPRFPLKDINPGGMKAPGRNQNCANCAVALDSTLAGRQASALPSGPTKLNILEKLYNRQFTAATEAGIRYELGMAGPGSRGIVYIQYSSTDAHVLNAVNQRGVVKFLDAQSAREGSTLIPAKPARLMFMRTD